VEDCPELPVKGSDEVSMLAASFNRLRRSLVTALGMIEPEQYIVQLVLYRLMLRPKRNIRASCRENRSRLRGGCGHDWPPYGATELPVFYKELSGRCRTLPRHGL
jgi:hypothetical protein